MFASSVASLTIPDPAIVESYKMLLAIQANLHPGTNEASIYSREASIRGNMVSTPLLGQVHCY